jgi:hypothetical protein
VVAARLLLDLPPLMIVAATEAQVQPRPFLVALSLMLVVAGVEVIKTLRLAQAAPVAGEMAAHLRMPQVRLARLTPVAVAVAEETVLLAPQAAQAAPVSSSSSTPYPYRAS